MPATARKFFIEKICKAEIAGVAGTGATVEACTNAFVALDLDVFNARDMVGSAIVFPCLILEYKSSSP
jgi:hypothetical protein